jgi:CHAD domain-containing protein
MTPGLAGFIASGNAYGGAADGDASPAWDDAVTAVTAALEQGFTVVTDRIASTAAERRTWFDTFDWRLFKAGLLLEYVPGRRGSELRLTSVARAEAATGATGDVGDRADMTPEAVTQLVTGWQPSRPHPLRDIPPGVIADRVGKLIAPRALLPVATVTETSAVSRLLNEDAKTVARLVVERPVLAATGDAVNRGADRDSAAKDSAARDGATVDSAIKDNATRDSSATRERSRPLAPRFTIQPVRGYLGQARRAARLLEETGSVTPASGTVLEDALAAMGRRPGDYSNKVDAPVTADMPASRAVALILLRLLDIMEANTDGVVRDIDTEFLHDFRVAVRRSRAALKLFGDILSGAGARGAGARGAGTRTRGATAPDVTATAAEFKWLGDLTTPTRDLDVHLLGFDDTAAGLRAAKPDDLEPFRTYLLERRSREFRALARGLRSPRFRDLTGQWRDTLTPISEKGGRGRGGSTRSGEISAATLAAERTRRAFAKVARQGGAITADSPHEALHNLRKRCKELRYALEFFAPLHDPATYAAGVGDLKKLQDCLGEFQDSQVQIDEIRSLATAMQAAGEAPAVTLLAMGEVTARLAVTQAAARADFERRFAVFAGIDGQRRMSVLLRGGGT